MASLTSQSIGILAGWPLASTWPLAPAGQPGLVVAGFFPERVKAASLLKDQAYKSQKSSVLSHGIGNTYMGFPGSSAGKESSCNAGDPG